jgi:hypothetical protein
MPQIACLLAALAAAMRKAALPPDSAALAANPNFCVSCAKRGCDKSMRIFLLSLLMAALPLAAATKWDKKVQKTADAVRAGSARAPGVALDTAIKAAELLRPTHPQLAWQFAASAAEQMKTSGLGAQFTQRLTTVLMAIDPAEGEKIARTLPEQSVVYTALVSYWTKKEDPVRAADVLKEAWAKGFYLPSAGSVLSSLRAKQPEAADALFRTMLDQLQPDKAGMDPVRAMFAATRAVAAKNPTAATAALVKLLDVVSRENFNAESPQEIAANFKLGDKNVETYGARDSYLLPIGIYLHALDADLYAKNEKLFEPWRGEIAKLKPGDETKAANAGAYMLMPRDMLEKRKAERRPLLEPAKPDAEPAPAPPPFADAFAKARAGEREAQRASALSALLRREDFTPPQQLQIVQELLRIVPGLAASSRFQTAATAFRAASDMDLKPALKPAANALASALAALEQCKEPACESARKSGRALPAYDDLALAVRRSKLRVDDAAVAARASLIDLRDVLEENWDFKLPGIQGTDYALRAQRGRVVMLNFWATW